MALPEKKLIPAEVFVILLFANAEQFEGIIQKQQWGDFIQQMSMEDFRKSKFSKGFYDAKFTYSKKVIVCENVIVDGEIEIVDKTKEEAIDWIVFISSDLGNVHFKKSEIRGETSAFKFARCTTGSFKIYKSKVGDFEFVNCLITAKDGHGKIEILESETGYFQFRGCKVGSIRIHRRSKTGYFRSDNSQIEGFEIANSTAEYFRIKENSKIVNFTIKNDSKADLFSIEKSEMCDFIFESGSVRLLTYNSSKINKFSLSGNNKFDIFISEGKINSLILRECILGLETSISISDTEIFYLQMVKFAVIGNLFLRNISPLAESIKFMAGTDEMSELYEKVKVDIEKNLPKKPTFLLFHSSLGKTEFTNCELKRFTFNYSNSNLIDSFIVGGDLPIYDIQIVTKIEFDEDGKETLTLAHKNNSECPYQKASLFNQLKKVLERAGDTYGSSHLQSEWADNQLEYLKLVKRKRLKGEKKGSVRITFRKILEVLGKVRIWFKNWFANIQIYQDIISFRINKYSNNHDENWVLALAWIMGFVIVFYFLFLLAQEGTPLETKSCEDSFVSYFKSLNPLNDSYFSGDEKIPPMKIVLVNFSAKLILGFFIYKFLRAFRKYGKK